MLRADLEAKVFFFYLII